MIDREMIFLFLVKSPNKILAFQERGINV